MHQLFQICEKDNLLPLKDSKSLPRFDADRPLACTTRFALICISMATALIAVASLGCQKKPTRTGEVVGSSMAPNFVGLHYRVQCVQCGIEFTCDHEQADERNSLVCPNCANIVAFVKGTLSAADEVKLDLAPTEINRWDVIAFKIATASDSPKEQTAGIKRVIGLPGESIELRQGNVLVDGQLVRKSLPQQKATRIHTYDSMYLTDDDAHWNPRSDEWAIGRFFLFTPTKPNQDTKTVRTDEIRWLGYRHQRHYSHQLSDEEKSAAAPIEDAYGFNQSLGRQLNPMDEIFVSIDATISKASIVAWKFDYRGTVFICQLDVAQKMLSVAAEGSNFPSVAIPISSIEFDKPKLIIEFSSIDQQLNIWINANQYFQHELPDSQSPVAVNLLDIGAAGGKLAVNRIRVWRDLYFTPQGQGGLSGKKAFPADEGLIVLGDNVPLSIDSRTWDQPRLKETDVIGKVISR